MSEPWTRGWRHESHYRGHRAGIASNDDDGSLKLDYVELDDSRFLKEFQVQPGQRYKATVHAVGCDIVPQNENGAGANICVFGTWTRSSEFNNGCGSFAGPLTVDFKGPSSGKVMIGLRLGFWSCEARGSVTFTDMHIEKNDDWITYGNGQVRIDMLCTDSSEIPDVTEVFRQTERLSAAYYAMAQLYGKVPFNGDPVFLEVRHGIRAWAWAGNPIVWNASCCINFFRDLEKGDNACFGTFHEMGHNFDQTCLTAINCELMANFGLSYAVEKLDSPIFFDGQFTTGRGLQDVFYKKCYERTIAVGNYHHDGLLWCILRVKDAIGWKPFETVMRNLLAVKQPKRSPTETFDMWMRCLSDVSGVNVQALFPGDEYVLIMSQQKL